MSAERNYSEPDDEMIKRSRNWKGGSNPLPTRSGEHGCPLGCIYCNQISLDRNTSGEKVAGYLFQGVDSVISLNTRIMSGSQVVMEISTDDILSELSKYPHFNPKSPFLIENFNDPGLNWGQSIEVAKRLVTELGHSGPSIFITKMPISQRRIEEMKRLQKIGGKPIVIVTYSGHPKEIEPASGPKRIEAIKKLHGNNIPTVLSMRPMIEGINITDENIRRVANEAGVYASVITVGGLFVYQPETIEVFEKAGYHLSDLYRNNKYPPAKVLPKNVKGTVRQIMREEGVGANVHDHTSCAVAEISTVVYGDPTPDRLAHWAGDVKPNFDYCQSKCHPKQLVICKRTSERKVNEVIKDAQEALIKIGYQHEIVPSLTQAGMLLVKGGSLTIGEVFTLTERCGWQVNNWPDKETVMYRTHQAVTQDLGEAENKILGAVPVGQEWYVFLNGNIDGEGNQLAIKWIRNRNRARIQAVDAKTILGDIGNYADRLSSLSLGLQSKQEIKDALGQICRSVSKD